MAAPDRVAMPLNRRKRAADTDGRPVDDPAAAKPQRQRKARGRGRGRGVSANRDDDDAAAPGPSVTMEAPTGRGRGRGAGRGRGFGPTRPGDAAPTPAPGAGRGRGRGVGRGRGAGAAAAARPGGGADAGDKENGGRVRKISEGPSGVDDPDVCDICDNRREFTSVGLCQHPLCHTCMIRLRTFPNKHKPESKEKPVKWPCPICREPLDKVIIAEGTQACYDHTSVQYLPVDKKLQIAFDSHTAEAAFKEIAGMHCPECPAEVGTDYQVQDALRRHLSQVHEKFHCDLCVTNQKLFTFEHITYTRKELVKHKRSRDGTTKAEIHPRCEFCDTRFFDGDGLAEHLHRKHENCHLCEKAGRPNQFFVNYGALEDHFEQEHFLCPDAECKRGKAAMFPTRLELEAHIAATHSGGKGGRISLQSFQSDRSAGGRRGPGPRAHGDHSRPEEEEHHQPIAPPADLFSGPTLGQAVGRGDGLTGSGPAPGGAAPPAGHPMWGGAGHAPQAARPPTGAEAFPTLGSHYRNVPVAQVGLWTTTGPSKSKGGGGGSSRSAPNVGGADFPGLGGPGLARQMRAPAATPSNWTITVAPKGKKKGGGSSVKQAPTMQQAVALAAPVRVPAYPTLGSGGGGGGEVSYAAEDDYYQAPAQPAGPSQAPEYRIAEPSIAVVTQFESREQKLAAHRSKGPAPAASSAAAFPTLGGGGGVGGGGGGITWGGGVKIAKKKAKPKAYDSSGSLRISVAASKKGNKKAAPSYNNTPSYTAAPAAAPDSYPTLGAEDGYAEDGYAYVEPVIAPKKGPSQAPEYRVAPPSIAVVTEFQTREQKLAAHRATQGSLPVVDSDAAFPTLGGPPGGGGGAQWQAKTNAKPRSAAIIDPAVAGGTVPFVPPPGFAERNAAMIGAILDVVGDDNFELFKDASGQMRSGEIGFRDFFKTSMELLGDSAALLFPELVALLPDIQTQQNMYIAAHEYSKRKKQAYGDAGFDQLSVCPWSGQILLEQDVAAHMAELEVMQFPGLGGGGGGGGSKKKKKNAGGSKPLDFRSKAAAPARPDGREAYKMEQAEHERWGGSQWSQ